MAPIDFFVDGKDNGTNNAESLQRWSNAEPWNQEVARRVPENLRTRTEVLRKRIDELEHVVASDRAYAFVPRSDAGSVLANAYLMLAGTTRLYFTLRTSITAGTSNAGIDIIPQLSMATTAGGTALPAQFVKDGLTITLNGTAVDGANNVYLEIVRPSPDSGSIVVTVTGNEGTGAFPLTSPVNIHVAAPTGSTLGELVTALKASDASDYLDDTNTTAAGHESDLSFTVAREPLYMAGTSGSGAVAAEGYRVTGAMLNTFFNSADPDYANKLQDGDTLVINFATHAERHACVLATDLSSRLGVIANNSAPTANQCVVPICKRVGDSIYFANGWMLSVGDATPYRNVAGTVTDVEVTAGIKGDNLTNLAIPAGTVSSQVSALVDIMVTRGGVVVVSPDASARDYARIGDAINSVASLGIGGTVLVLPGTYTENITVGALSTDVRVVAATHGGVTISPEDDDVALITMTASLGASRLSFHGVSFVCTGEDSACLDADVAPTHARGLLSFENCKFVCEDVSDFFCVAAFPVRCSYCTFDVTNSNTHHPRLFNLQRVDAVVGNYQFEIENCTFTGWKQLAFLKTDNAIGKCRFIFSNNCISACGYNSFPLIDTAQGVVSDTRQWDVAICDNSFVGTTATPTQFCVCRSVTGHISRNNIGDYYATGTAIEPIIYAMTLTGSVKVTDNRFGTCGSPCINVMSRCEVVGNTIEVLQLTSASSYFVCVDSNDTQVARNLVVSVAQTGGATGAALLFCDGANRVQINDNILNCNVTGVTGIKATSSHYIHVCRNHVYVNAGTGVYVGTVDNSLILENIVRSSLVGINVAASSELANNVIGSNHITCVDDGNAVGISIVEFLTKSLVAGNLVRVNSGLGINLAHATSETDQYNGVMGNYVFHSGSTDVDDSLDCESKSGGVGIDAYVRTHNWYRLT